MTPPATTLTPPREPVMLTIGRRPADNPTSALPVPLTAASIKDDEFQIIADLDEAAEVRGCGWLPWRAERR